MTSVEPRGSERRCTFAVSTNVRSEQPNRAFTKRERSNDRPENEMLETMKTPDKLMRTDAANSELRVGEVVYNPAPDADERLRRLFTLLIKAAANHRHTASECDDPAQVPTPNHHDEAA